MKWAFVAGGTGGHIYPAIAIADHLKRHQLADEIVFLTTEKVLDQEIIEQAGYPLYAMSGSGFNQTGLVQKIKALLNFVKLFFKSRKLIKQHQFDCVIGTGGYMSGPVLWSAYLAKKITATLEPNVVVGLSNQWVSSFVNKVFFAFEESKKFLNKKKCMFTGNPIRQTILNIAPPQEPKTKKVCVMIFGGSQGAKQINDLLIQAIPKLSENKDQVSFVHQTGKHNYKEVLQTYEKFNFEHEVHEYIFDIAKAYERADIIVGRAGSSILEIAACGRPSILIPYPYAADNHQQENAAVMEKNNASYVLTGKDIDVEDFVGCLKELILNQQKRELFRAGALSLRHDQAAKTIVDQLMQEFRHA
ncbi:undecaprenyldiphospho-muramoylpentapeptide beta-N-acetylglucosaminyltransferase [bacterium]|nr:undecaprenyldiphospho-muramoylpentapeptide beta-N-acetylglucosaminyltransferase [bacterium]